MNPEVPVKASATIEDAERIVFELYGIKASRLVELNGYDDWNYLVHTEKSEGGEKSFVLKIINSVDSKKPQVFEAQSFLLRHLENHGFVCPRPILTKNGKFFEHVKLNSGDHLVRLLEYIDGNILHKVRCTPSLFHQVGQIVGKMNAAMKSFRHPAYDTYESLWKLESVPKIIQFLFAISDHKKRKTVEDVVQQFRTSVLPISNSLEKGLIHGDFNEQNIIVEEVNGDHRIKAVIDFGDSHVTCYLFELAITMCYMMLVDKNVKAGGFVLAGYSSVRKVPEKELSLLRVCIAARLCQSLVLGAYSSLQDPGNSYVLTTAIQGWVLLDQIWNETDEGLLKKWKNI